MADPIGYTPTQPAPGVDAFTPEDDAARLLRTLHESGTLRVLNGLFAQFADVMAVALERLDTEEGHNALSNIALLGKALGEIDADGTDRFVTALTDGLDAAGRRLKRQDEPPNLLQLAVKLRSPEVRRGLDVALTLVGTMGQRLGDDRP